MNYEFHHHCQHENKITILPSNHQDISDQTISNFGQNQTIRYAEKSLIHSEIQIHPSLPPQKKHTR